MPAVAIPAVLKTSEVVAAIIGATATATTTAATMAQSAIQNSRSNLACSIEVWNGTSYPLTPVKSAFRKGAFMGGTEGTFIESPGDVPSQGYDVFSFEQVRGATTDVIGAVLYRNDKMDVLIGFHITDFAGFHRFLSAVPLPRGTGDQLFNSNWDALNLDGGLNQYTWSGAGRANKYTSKDIKAWGLAYKGDFIRGIKARDEKGDIVSESNGQIKIRQIDIAGDGKQNSFATKSIGGGQIMKVIVSDTPFATEIIDITGSWKRADGGNNYDITFVSDGLRVKQNDGTKSLFFYQRNATNPNKYVHSSGYYFDFQTKDAKHFTKGNKLITALYR